jgi:hypothetical protein
MSPTQTSQRNPAPSQVSPEINQRVAMLAAAGLNADELQAHLVKEGLDQETAAQLATRAAYIKALDRDTGGADDSGGGRRNMIKGALICLGGLAGTIISYHAAGPGGTFVVAGGAIVGGAILFLKGMFFSD